jgi:hypothetical protein
VSLLAQVTPSPAPKHGAWTGALLAVELGLMARLLDR